MGSITSHPKIPSAAATVYVPVAETAAATTDTSSGGSTTTGSAAGSTNTTTATTPTADQVEAQSRSQSLLDRSRGILSTVLTSFRGALADPAAKTQKTLLGE